MEKDKELDTLGSINDYENMPKWELQQRVINGDERAARVYLARYGNG